MVEQGTHKPPPLNAVVPLDAPAPIDAQLCAHSVTQIVIRSITIWVVVDPPQLRSSQRTPARWTRVCSRMLVTTTTTSSHARSWAGKIPRAGTLPELALLSTSHRRAHVARQGNDPDSHAEVGESGA